MSLFIGSFHDTGKVVSDLAPEIQKYCYFSVRNDFVHYFLHILTVSDTLKKKNLRNKLPSPPGIRAFPEPEPQISRILITIY